MVLWIFSLFTSVIIVIALYYLIQFKNNNIRIAGIIAFSLMLVGEIIDLMSGNQNGTLITVFIELLEMFVTTGFFTLIYYLKLQIDEKKKSLKRKKRYKK